MSKASVAVFTFNPFQENTYVVYDETKKCAIFDPGCFEQREKKELKAFIEDNGLEPVRLINTHCHIDHVFGNHFVSSTWGLDLEIHNGELPVLEAVPIISQLYGIPPGDPSPKPRKFIVEGEEITFGNTTLKALFTPGHSPASLSFYCHDSGFVIAGDVLFRESIGRTDLPGGDFDTLLNSIRTQLLTLDDEVVVYPGHGPATTIGHEKKFNPFL